MKLALMQPYFFPYLGYFSLIEAADYFVFFDTAQYMRGGWVNRNRILHPREGSNYLTIPIERSPVETPIRDIRIHITDDYAAKLLAKLEVYKKKAPYYRQVTDLFTRCLETPDNRLYRLNIECTLAICDYLQLHIDYAVLGDSDIELPDVTSADEWGLRVTQAFGYETFVNPHGGMDFYDRTKYTGAHIGLDFVKNRLREYDQRNDDFVPALSILDALMFCSPEEVYGMILDYELL